MESAETEGAGDKVKKLKNIGNVDKRYVGTLMRWLRIACVLLVIFDITTTVLFSIDSMKRSSLDTIARAESQISQYIKSVWQLGNAIAEAPATQDDSLSLRQRARMLVPYADEYDLYMIGITNEKGLLGSTLDRSQITSTHMLNDEGVGDLSSRPAFQKMMATGESILTDTYLAGADGTTLIYTIWIPYYKGEEIGGAITVSIKFEFIENIITSTSLNDDYYFTLFDSQNKISANPDKNLVDMTLKDAYKQSGWASISFEDLTKELNEGKTGDYWGINNNRVEYVQYMPVEGSSWKLVMRIDFFGSFKSTYYSLAIKLLVYLVFLGLFSMRKSREAITRERLFNMLTETVNEVFLAYNMDSGKMEYASSNSESVIGVKADAWVKNPEKTASEFGILLKDLKQETEKNIFYIDTVWDDPQRNEKRFLRFRVYKTKENGIKWAVVVITDDTEEQEKTQMLQEALETAENASLAKSEFLSRMSHEIRTPLNGIIGMTTIALSAVNDPVKVKDSLNKVNLSSRHLMCLVNDVLDMSKIESRKLVLHDESFDLVQFTKEFFTLVSQQAQEKQIEFQKTVYGLQEEEWYTGDTMRLKQILLNLFSNALKFTPVNGRIEFCVSKISSQERVDRIRFTVSDTGIGMSREEVEKSMNPFEQANSAVTQKYGGTGLGIPIIHSLVGLMNGRFEIQSERGAGTTCIVELPFKWSSAAPETADLKQEEEKEQEAKELKLSFLKGKKILVAEDNELNREIVEAVLEMEGVTSASAVNGQEVLRMFQTAAPGEYDAVLMDIQMPVMDGYEAAKAIRSSGHPDAETIPIIAVTADAFREDITAALEAGMDAHLAKPIDPDQLYQLLYDLLKGKRPL